MCDTNVVSFQHKSNSKQSKRPARSIGLSISTELTATLIVRQRQNGEGFAFIHRPNEQRPQNKICPVCSQRFRSKTTRAKYCSDACRAAAGRKRAKAGKQKKRVVQDGITRSGKTKIRVVSDCYELSLKDRYFYGSRELREGRYDKHCRFITLTFREIIPTDEEAKHLLDNFLKRQRRHIRKDLHYIWVSERQERGAIHFHILTPDRIMTRGKGEAWKHWRMRENNWINYNWNCVVANWALSSGKITAEQHTAWIEETKAFCRYYADKIIGKAPERPEKSKYMLLPNHLYVKNPGRYMAKYMSKMNERIAGNLWNCSTESRRYLKEKDKVVKDVQTIYFGNQAIGYIEKRAAQDGVFMMGWELPHNDARGVWCGDVYSLLQYFYEWMALYSDKYQV